MYWRRPDARQLAGFGLTPDDVRPAGIEVWEEHVPIINVFDALSTQWVMGMSGPTGLNYQALPFLLRLYGIPREDQRQLFEDLQVLEHAALKEMHRG
ncbi:DUF1799 domain-containing protein [Bordetella genomosp. 13]|uniref:DUF1799 domain-containing protein n=1 Tax=Bordetella genomosp. 13 TaxID=463040 RepID=UPI0011A0EABE|nr:DUF1799 domain-containing protein [Bordetella genomosp. 13]